MLAVMIILVAAISYMLLTREGSGIERHPVGKEEDPFVADPEHREDQVTGVDRTDEPEKDQRGKV